MAGVLGKGVDIRGEKHSLVTHPDHQRAFHPGAKQRVGRLGRDQGKSERPLEPVGCRHEGCFHVHALLIIIENQMHDHLGIGFRAEVETLVAKLLSEREIILNDAVVDNRKLIVHTDMWMGILLCHTTVGGPAGMGNTRLPGHL